MKKSHINCTLIVAKKTPIENVWAQPRWAKWDIVCQETPFHTNKTKLKNIIMRSYVLIEKYFLKPLGQFTIITEEAEAPRKLSNEVL